MSPATHKNNHRRPWNNNNNSSLFRLLLAGLTLFSFSARITHALTINDHHNQQHQQRRSASLEELVQRRMTRAFPYSGVSSYLRLTAAPNPQVLFAPSTSHHTFSNSLAHWRTPNNQQTVGGLPNAMRNREEPEIVELIDLLDNVEKNSNGEEDESPLLFPRERRSAAPVLKRYACRFKFCRIFDA